MDLHDYACLSIPPGRLAAIYIFYESKYRHISPDSLFLNRLRQAKIADGDSCMYNPSMYNSFIRNNRSIRSSLLTLLNLLAPIGWGQLALRIPAHKQRTRSFGISIPCGAVSTRGINVSACRSCRGMERFGSGDGTLLYKPGGAGSRNPSQSAISRKGWVSTPYVAVSIRGGTGFVPGLLEL